jgi:hypothetical protein
MQINLFTTYFHHDSEARQKELDFCLIKNFLDQNIDKLYLFLDEKTNESDVQNKLINSGLKPTNKIEFIKIDRVPTFRDWILFSKNIRDKDVSIFTNADIYFDSSILKFKEYIRYPKSIICLSRHDDLEDGRIELHQNPEWSQDSWAMTGESIRLVDFNSDLEISTGKCRCDNKLAYVFAVNGWDIYNPCKDLKCIHKHSSKIRDYNKFDKCIMGALAFVGPTISGFPSSLEISIMPINTKNIKKISLNSWLCQNQT